MSIVGGSGDWSEEVGLDSVFDDCDLFAGTRQRWIRWSLNAGVTTTMRSERSYRNLATAASV